ncbi:hypothetical protein AB0N97_05830 [Streptomyces collinus]|uniref:Spore-associated protein A n=1 Tax=Streptomyces violaceochromogenes TaxID=67377 RepID=A0ABU6M6Z7_9ACTN|nr:hypothetical protein [Streptomyces violaceochromogenes]MEC7056186.1 hypothetical protein [Streptomyces violaceochromogenes]GHC68365.1 hypothetical protein GCM10010309_34410 [Streptomyces violaceochromogenes]
MFTRSVRRNAVVAAALALTAVTATSADAAADSDTKEPKIIELGGSKGLKMIEGADGKALLQADATVTAAAANVCGSGYTISAGAARYGTNASLYLWWNGKYSGSNKLYDKYICGVLFNDTGAARSMGIRLKDNFTDTPHAEDFGTYSTYAGPVYQKRGGCGEAYSYMKSGSRVVVDNIYTMSGCN